MPLECINELENKVDRLIDSLQKTRNENREINSKIRQLEEENSSLKNELDGIKDNSVNSQAQLDAAAQKIKEVITKLETVEQP